MRGNEPSSSDVSLTGSSEFTIPMRGNEQQVIDSAHVSTVVYDPHEG